MEQVFQSLDVLGKGLASRLGDGELGIGFATDELLDTAYIARLFQVASVAGEISVGDLQQRLQRGEVSSLIGHQDRHDAQSDLVLKCFI